MKKIMSVLIVITCFLGLGGCKKDVNDIDDELCVKGVVSETGDEYIVIDVNEDDDLYKDYSSVMVLLDVEIKDDMKDFTVGDEVAVYYGSIKQSQPPQIHEVYKILYIGVSK